MKMAGTKNPIQFVQEVRAEVAKVVWPSRREVMITSTMVLVLALLTATFFFLVDFMIRQGLQGLLTMVG
jgi:preprotein translocase subunit SecE